MSPKVGEMPEVSGKKNDRITVKALFGYSEEEKEEDYKKNAKRITNRYIT